MRYIISIIKVGQHTQYKNYLCLLYGYVGDIGFRVAENHDDSLNVLIIFFYLFYRLTIGSEYDPQQIIYISEVNILICWQKNEKRIIYLQHNTIPHLTVQLLK